MAPAGQSMRETIAANRLRDPRIILRGEVKGTNFFPGNEGEPILGGSILEQFDGQAVSITIRPKKRQYVPFTRNESVKLSGKYQPMPDTTPADADRKNY